MAVWRFEPAMSSIPEFVGTIHIYLGPYRGNPIALYSRHVEGAVRVSPIIDPWNRFVGIGETVNKAAADFDAKWKAGDLAPDVYSGPHWEGGIKPEKPKPPPKPKPPAATKPETPETSKSSETSAPTKPDANTAAASPTTTGDSAAPGSASSPPLAPPPAAPATDPDTNEKR